ncbi:MAG: hypothetical protein JJU37_12595 [Balneolaceae bacterium]|nr:hypothetical protein [Balneolaceae bacterium]
MGTGQTLLALAAIVLLSIITMSIRQMYVQSVNTTVNSQHTADALNFGRDISERIHTFSTRYLDFVDEYGGCTADTFDLEDVDTNCIFEMNSMAGESYIATLLVSPEGDIDIGPAIQTGRVITIRIFSERDDVNTFRAEYRTILTNLTP